MTMQVIELEMCRSLRGFQYILDPVDESFLQEKFRAVKEMSRRAQANLAFLGDRIIHLAVGYYLVEQYDDDDLDVIKGLHQASQYFVTGKALAYTFDWIKLETPVVGNTPFSDHTKGDKVEQLAAYLQGESSSDPDCASQFCRLMRLILDMGNHDLRIALGIIDYDDFAPETTLLTTLIKAGG